MKSKINREAETEMNFPKLMEYKDKEGATIILATGFSDCGNHYKGVVLHCGLNCDVDKLPKGTFRSTWSKEYKDFNGTIELSN